MIVIVPEVFHVSTNAAANSEVSLLPKKFGAFDKPSVSNISAIIP